MIAGRANPEKGRPPNLAQHIPEGCLRPASKRQQRPDSKRSEGLERQGKSGSPPQPRGRAGRARNKPHRRPGGSRLSPPPTHTQGTRGARARTRSRTTRQPPGKPPPGNRGGPWRGRKRGGTPAWGAAGGGQRSLEETREDQPPRLPTGPTAPAPWRPGAPPRVFNPPRRDALGTWTGWRRARWAGDEGAPATPPTTSTPTPPGAAAGPTKGNPEPRRCRPVTEAPTGLTAPTDRRRPTPLASPPPPRPPHDPSSPPIQGRRGRPAPAPPSLPSTPSPWHRPTLTVPSPAPAAQAPPPAGGGLRREAGHERARAWGWRFGEEAGKETESRTRTGPGA